MAKIRMRERRRRLNRKPNGEGKLHRVRRRRMNRGTAFSMTALGYRNEKGKGDVGEKTMLIGRATRILGLTCPLELSLEEV